jgi:Sec-independent protein translocase protein TatA
MELGSGEILLILIVALLVYGGRLPDVARAVGHSFGELKRGLSETKDAVASQLDTGIDDDAAHREVRRFPAHEDLAKEDISKAAAEPPATGAPPRSEPGGPTSA